ncbi:MAG: TauD/TfdA family dioxygenase [Actinomycetia bacterium]|nr:TauD/TfdA family dioxygenase [Actinomycetes bacterium]
MELIPLSAALGVEVRGFDATKAPTPDELATLLQAYDEHHLLLIRGQSFEPPAQEAFVGLFGPLIDDMGNGNRSAFISNIEMIDGGGGSGMLPFHSDLSFTRSPVHGLALYAVALPEGGTETLFASSAHAAATLPPDLRARVEGRSVHHVLPVSTNLREFKARDLDVIGTDPEMLRPALFEHPRNGQEVLYVTDLHAHSIEGLARDESAQLLDDLFAHLYADENIYVHHWQLGDLVVWDNVALQHARGDVSQGGERTFRRTSMNEFSVIELLPALITIGTDS